MRNKLIISISLFLIVVLSVWLRIYLPSEDVFAKDRIRFSEVDSYYHMRLADYTYEHFPYTMDFDPLLDYTGGYKSEVITIIDEPREAKPMLGWLVAAIQHYTGIDRNLVAAYFPAIMGLLLIIPMYFIGLLLVNKWAGLLMAAMVSVMPGELLARTSLGYFDNHASEILLSMLVIMFIIMAFKKHWLWGIVAGVMLGLYNLNWTGAPMFTGLIIVWVAIQNMINHFRKVDGAEKDKLASISVVMFATSLVVFLGVFNFQKTYLIIYGLAVLLPFVMLMLSNIMSRVKPYYYVALIMGIGLLSLGVVYLVKPMMFSSIGQNLGFIVSESGDGNTMISGMKPLDFTTSWIYYGLVLWVGIAGLGFMIANKDRFKPEIMLIIVWAIATIVLSVVWVRFNYYLAVSMALLSAYFAVELARKGFLKEMRGVATGIFLFIFLFLPNTMSSVKVAQYHPFMPSWGWMETLDWLKGQGGKVELPNGVNYVRRSWDSLSEYHGEYSVLSWWDYGYWIVRESDKAVVCSPTGSDTQKVAAKIFTSNGNNILKELDKYKVKYIVVSWEMVGDKYKAMSVMGNKTELKDSLVYRLWNANLAASVGDEITFLDNGNKFRVVFVSEAKRNRQPEVKVFERSVN